MNPPARIIIEAQTKGDSRSMFRLLIDEKIVGENLTAAEAHLLVGEILDRVVLPGPAAATIPLDELNASNDE